MKQRLLWKSFTLSFEILADIRQYLRRQSLLLSLPYSTSQSLELVTTEYLTNLLRHQDAPASEVTLQFFRQHQDLCFEITDNGQGWEDLAQMLDQAALPTELSTGGMGLALISTLLPNNHYLHQAGSNRFVFTLPETPALPSLLIIDDSPSQLTLLREYLKADYEVTTFSSAKEALHWLKSNPCDLVITDLHMPQMNGFEFRHSVGRLPNHALLPFIFLTGDDMETTRNLAATQAIDDYLIKPVQKELLINTLSRVLSRHEHLDTLYEQKLLSGLAPQLASSPEEDAPPRWQFCYDSYPELSGDFCLTQHYPDGRTRLVMGDQMGHGPLARANGAAWLGYIQGLLTRHDCDLTTLIKLINRELYRASHIQPHLISLLVLEVNKDNVLTVINAGMPPYILCQSNTPKAMQATIGLLGTEPEIEVETECWQLSANDSVHCFSDGISEYSSTLTHSHWPPSLTSRHSHIWLHADLSHHDDRSLLSIAFEPSPISKVNIKR
ncbi:response regulator [Thaumasiovibrio subtropicus]|uniref:response regulator n=1 Tax=Thaumasiovibrio subtropicus TaxID=1891207 RepID=UPI000B3524A3|nr:response regulator [Thaumasiovibrio subtropicus]